MGSAGQRSQAVQWFALGKASENAALKMLWDAVFEISKSLLSEPHPKLLDKTLLDELTQLKRLIEIPKLGSDSESSTAALKKELVEASKYFTCLESVQVYCPFMKSTCGLSSVAN